MANRAAESSPQIERRLLPWALGPVLSALLVLLAAPVAHAISPDPGAGRTSPEAVAASLDAGRQTPDGLRADGRAASTKQAKILTAVVRIGREHAISDRGIVIALAAVVQASNARNLDYGRSMASAGVFMQTTGWGWGTRKQTLTPELAIAAFYGVSEHATAPGLVDLKGWESMDLGDAAQRVQSYGDSHEYGDRIDEAVANLARFSPDSKFVKQYRTEPRSHAAAVPTWNGTVPAAFRGEPGGRTKPVSIRAARVAHLMFGRSIAAIGGQSNRGSECSYSDHCTGYAIDLMIKDWDTAGGNAAGWQVAQFFMEHAAALQVKYIIWNKQKWSPHEGARSPSSWRSYNTPRGVHNATNDHFNHVHVSFQKSRKDSPTRPADHGMD